MYEKVEVEGRECFISRGTNLFALETGLTCKTGIGSKPYLGGALKLPKCFPSSSWASRHKFVTKPSSANTTNCVSGCSMSHIGDVVLKMTSPAAFPWAFVVYVRLC